MASRSTIKSIIRTYLGAESDDPAFSDDVLNPIVQQACDSLVADIQKASPQYLVKSATLTADSSSSHNYTLASQSTAITDFAGWLAVRWTDDAGLALHEVRLEELRDAGPDHFTITGPDESAVLVTSPDSGAGKDVWMRYTYWPEALSSDASTPGGIPSRFHDVIAMECLFVYGFGGEQTLPRELYNRWQDRRNQMLSHVGRRGVQQSRTRVYVDAFE